MKVAATMQNHYLKNYIADFARFSQKLNSREAVVPSVNSVFTQWLRLFA